ncbi:MAG: hypothetical protein HC904_06570 [Blastochloris sp.]|nr:hypothetical protein [Blastochloris sp.]
MQQTRHGFSLIEVTLALGVMAFSVTVLIGLLSASLKTNKESMEQVKAANLAATMISQRRATPLNTDPLPPNAALWLPELKPSPAGEEKLNGSVDFTFDGDYTSVSNEAFFRTYYSYVFYPNANDPIAVHIHLRIQWPAFAPADQADSYELVSTLPLP